MTDAGAAIPAVLMRGGTSKAAMFLAADMPADAAERDRLLLALYGSPDPSGRQLDGIGGGTSSTSKAAIIGPSADPRAHVDYLFAQIGIHRAKVDLQGNCGNISAAVGPFAVDSDLVAATGTTTEVRIRNVNTDTIIVAHVPTRDGRFDPAGDFAIPGVPGTGAAIRLDFEDPAGAVTGALLPSGAVCEELSIAGRRIRSTIIDAANPVVIVRADDLGLPHAVEADLDTADVHSLVASVRAEGAVRAGIVSHPDDATNSPAVPRVVLVCPATRYSTSAGLDISGEDVDVVTSMFSMGRPHPALPFTGAVAIAVAARIEGSIVHEVSRPSAGSVRIGHPAGVQTLDAIVHRRHGEWTVDRVSSNRTARRLMAGALEVPPSHEGET